MPPKQRRFRPWEDTEETNTGADTPTARAQGYDFASSQYHTRSFSSSSLSQLYFTGALDPDLGGGQRSVIGGVGIQTADPASAVGATASLFDDSSGPVAVQNKPTRKRSLHTLRSKPTLTQSQTTDSTLSLSGGESLSRHSGPRIRNASVACLQCKAKRRKCINNGRPPCEACLSSDIPCVIDHTLDQRRKAAHQRRSQQIEQEKHLLGDLLRVLRQPDMSQASAALDFIRTGASHEQLSEYVGLRLPSLPNDEGSAARGLRLTSSSEDLSGRMTMPASISDEGSESKRVAQDGIVPDSRPLSARSSPDLSSVDAVATEVFGEVETSAHILDGQTETPRTQSRSPKRLRILATADMNPAKGRDEAEAPRP